MNRYQARHAKMMAVGKCIVCGKDKTPGRMLVRLCTRCALRDNSSKRNERSTRKLVLVTPYECTLPCLRCGQKFWTPDRRSTRCCEKCRDRQQVLADACDLDAGMFDV